MVKGNLDLVYLLCDITHLRMVKKMSAGSGVFREKRKY
jgi:hypothetical protein